LTQIKMGTNKITNHNSLTFEKASTKAQLIFLQKTLILIFLKTLLLGV